MAASRSVLALAACAVLAACGTVVGAPADGHYDGELCVATNANPQSCGPADVRMANGLAQVQVADIVYRLALKNGRVDLVLMHGTMQIDEFNAPFTWQDRVLRFEDPDKPVRYRIRFADPTPKPG
jgi:hypothetical protein